MAKHSFTVIHSNKKLDDWRCKASKSALNTAPPPPPPPMVYSTDRSKAVVPVLVLLFVVYSTRRFVLCLTLCHFVLVFFSPFNIAITSLGEERANLSAFRTFVRFVLVWICWFALPLCVWEGLRFVIVALPGLFSYPLSSGHVQLAYG